MELKTSRHRFSRTAHLPTILAIVLALALIPKGLALQAPSFSISSNGTVGDQPHRDPKLFFGWGGFIRNRESVVPLLEKLEEDGWTTVRYQSVPQWAQPTWGSADINHGILRLLIDEAKKRSMYVMLNIAHNFYMYGEPTEGFPGFYIDGHFDDWISQYIMDASPYKTDDNVIFEILNEYGSNRQVQQEELEQYLNTMIQTLRSEGFYQTIQCNFWWNNKIVRLNDPVNNYMIGLHYYGQSFDRYNPNTPVDFEKACLESGVKSEIQGIFSSSVSTSNRLGIPFCVTELGASWTYSDKTIPGGYVYSVGGIAYVMKFLEYAQQYNASVIMHRIGSNSDYEVYYEKAEEYFDLDFWK